MLRSVEWLVEVARVALAAPSIERARRGEDFGPLLERLRRRGRASSARSAGARERLRRAIAFVDARFPGGGNCYRRVLLEVALDPTAARSRVGLGLNARTREGHCWLEPEAADATYEAQFHA